MKDPYNVIVSLSAFARVIHDKCTKLMDAAQTISESGKQAESTLQGVAGNSPALLKDNQLAIQLTTSQGIAALRDAATSILVQELIVRGATDEAAREIAGKIMLIFSSEAGVRMSKSA